MDTLYLTEGVGEALLLDKKRVDGGAEEELSCGIESVAEELVGDIQDTALGDVVICYSWGALDSTIGDVVHKDLNMLLMNMQIRNTVLNELWTDELSRCLPKLAIRSEDRVAEELLPLRVKELALSVVIELSSKNGFDVLHVGGEHDTLACWTGLQGVASLAVAVEETAPAFEVGVLHGVVDGAGDHVQR